MACDTLEPPEQIRSAITDLWNSSFKNEANAVQSARFRMLERLCSSAYAGVTGSRLPTRPTSNLDQQRLHGALERFFRWTGAPWHEGRCPDAAETACCLHAAFLISEVKRTYFAPLDRLELIDITKHPREILKYVRFGPNEVELLEEDGLAHRIPIAALRRFDRRYWFPLERRLAGFYWLIGTAPEAPGPIWERTWSAILDTLVSEIGRLALYEPAYPAPVEDALFVLLLRLVKTPSGEPWKPFAIPWIYSITDDPFAEPPRAPDPSSLTWTLVGDEHHEFEVPDRSEEFKVVPEELTGVLEQRWRQLRTISERQYKRPNFNLLTKHFFVKAFAEESIDELLANLSCIEATLMLPKEKNRKMMMKRYKSLVVDDDAYATLDHAYCLRNKYLHSTGNPADAISWKDLAMARWSVTKAVDRYLSLTETRGDLNRQELLCLLERQDPSNR